MWVIDSTHEWLAFVALVAAAVAGVMFLARKSAAFGRWAMRRRERADTLTELAGLARDIKAAIGENGGSSLHGAIEGLRGDVHTVGRKLDDHLADHRRWQRESEESQAGGE